MQPLVAAGELLHASGNRQRIGIADPEVGARTREGVIDAPLPALIGLDDLAFDEQALRPVRAAQLGAAQDCVAVGADPRAPAPVGANAVGRVEVEPVALLAGTRRGIEPCMLDRDAGVALAAFEAPQAAD